MAMMAPLIRAAASLVARPGECAAPDMVAQLRLRRWPAQRAAESSRTESAWTGCGGLERGRRIHLQGRWRTLRPFAPVAFSWEALKTNFGCAVTSAAATFSDPGGTVVFEKPGPGRLPAGGRCRAADGAGCAGGEAGRPTPARRVRLLLAARAGAEGRARGGRSLSKTQRGWWLPERAPPHRRAVRGGHLGSRATWVLRKGELFMGGPLQRAHSVPRRKLGPQDFEGGALTRDADVRPAASPPSAGTTPRAATQRVVLVTEGSKRAPPPRRRSRGRSAARRYGLLGID